MVKIKNISVDDDYHSQVNNKYFPFEACMPTSFIMALKNEGIVVDSWDKVTAASPPSLIHPIGMQPEDYLMALLRSPWGLEMRDAIPWAKDGNISPNEVHAVVSKAVNAIVGMEVTEFLEKKTVYDLAAQIEMDHPAVVSGAFTGKGHAVAVVGAIWAEDGELTHLIVDDPYGNYFTGYKDRHGNNTQFPIKEFDRLWPGWFHRFDKNGV